MTFREWASKRFDRPGLGLSAGIEWADVAAAWEAAREECAKVCDEEGAEWDSDDVVPEKNYAAHCAKRIRAL